MKYEKEREFFWKLDCIGKLKRVRSCVIIHQADNYRQFPVSQHPKHLLPLYRATVREAESRHDHFELIRFTFLVSAVHDPLEHSP